MGSAVERAGRGRLAALAWVLGLAACASSSETAPPAPLTDIKAPIAMQVAWQVTLGDGRGSFLRPTVLEGAVFAASAAGEVVRVEPATGHVQWRVKIAGPLGAGVGADGFTVAVAGSRGEIYAYGADGNLLWTGQVPSDVVAAPLVGHDLVLVRSSDQRVSAFEAATGKRRWVFQRQQPPLALRAATDMAFSGDNVLVGFPGGRLIAIALANGAQRWEASVSEPKGATEVERLADVLGSLAVSGRDACAASYQGRIACFDTASGDPRWAREFAAGGGVALSAERVFGIDSASGVQAYTRESGASIWQSKALQRRGLTSPAVGGRLVAVGDFQGYVHFLSADEGNLVGRMATDGSAIVAMPQPWAGGWIVQTLRGELLLLRQGG